MRRFSHVPIFQKAYKSYRMSFVEKSKMHKVSFKVYDARKYSLYSKK